jgi:hypothetical protein
MTEHTRKLVAVSLVLMPIAILVFVGFAIYVADELHQIEDQLAYRPPDQRGTDAPPLPAEPLREGHTVYVPVYSHVYAERGRPYLLTATLSIRNTDLDKSLVVKAVRYYDTHGELVRRFLDEPLTLAPLATAEYLIEDMDATGGSGANFIVQWAGPESINTPVIEAVMIGTQGSQGISFICPGREIIVPEPDDAPP